MRLSNSNAKSFMMANFIFRKPFKTWRFGRFSERPVQRPFEARTQPILVVVEIDPGLDPH
jgi:hypothetical protein